MRCEDCGVAAGGAAHPLEWNRFELNCLQCGARYICFIRRMRTLSEKQRSQRMAKALADWVAWGHDERELRTLAARTPKDWEDWAREHRHRR